MDGTSRKSPERGPGAEPRWALGAKPLQKSDIYIQTRLVVLESGLGLESRLKSFFAGLGLGLGLGCCWTCYKSDTNSLQQLSNAFPHRFVAESLLHLPLRPKLFGSARIQ